MQQVAQVDFAKKKKRKKERKDKLKENIAKPKDLCKTLKVACKVRLAY